MLYISADRYESEKEKWEGMSAPTMTQDMSMYMKPVDLNYAYVPMEVTKASKDSGHDMDMAAECNLTRFGLHKC